MQPEQAQAKPEEKITQAQTPPVQQQEAAKIKEEPKPDIKTEENQANWRKFREDREAKRKEAEAAQKMAAEERARADALKAALEAITNKPAPQYGEQQEESEDERIQKKIDAAVEARIQKERLQYQQEQQQREQQELPTKIRQAFPDFNQVCSAENTDYLEYHYPEVASAFNHMPDSFEKWANVYKAVKRFVPNTDSRRDQAKAEKNMQKPGSLSAPGAAQGQSGMPAARLDEARKASNWERMQRTLKGLS